MRGSTGRQRVPFDVFRREIDLPLPPVPEQRKIASVLYNVDEAIRKTEEIIEQTKRVKKGAMQELFTEGYYEHKEISKHYFGRVPSDWDIRKLKDVGGFRNGLDFSSEQKGEGTLITNVPNIYGTKYVHPEELDRVNISDSEIERFGLEEDDIILVRSSKKEEGVGQAAIFKGHEEDVVHAGFTIRLRPNSDEVIPEYLVQYLRYSKTRKRVISLGRRVTLTNISQGDYSKLEVPIPPVDEQRKICDSLQGLDDEIAQQEKIKPRLHRLKRALMQDLLTGEVRTKDRDIDVLPEVEAHG